MAHLAEYDPIWFRRYGAIRDATRGYLNFVRNTLYSLVLFFCVQFMLGARGRHFTIISAIRQLLMIVCVGALITTAVPVARGSSIAISLFFPLSWNFVPTSTPQSGWMDLQNSQAYSAPRRLCIDRPRETAFAHSSRSRSHIYPRAKESNSSAMLDS
jgi:hypothetical protein